MNILLWVLQVLLGGYYLMGGSWMMSKVPPAWTKIMPKPFWVACGLLQALFAIGLVLPAVLGMPKLVSVSAVCVAVETLLVGVINKTKPKGLLWILIPALLVLFVAYERSSMASPF